MKPVRRTQVALVAAGSAVVLGYIGHRAVPHGAYSPTAALYWSISLFAERVGPTPGGTLAAVDIARFLALGVIADAAFTAAALVLRDRADAWRVRHLARHHVIVAGTGSGAAAGVDALRSAGKRRRGHLPRMLGLVGYELVLPPSRSKSPPAPDVRSPLVSRSDR